MKLKRRLLLIFALWCVVLGCAVCPRPEADRSEELCRQVRLGMTQAEAAAILVAGMSEDSWTLNRGRQASPLAERWSIGSPGRLDPKECAFDAWHSPTSRFALVYGRDGRLIRAIYSTEMSVWERARRPMPRSELFEWREFWTRKKAR